MKRSLAAVEVLLLCPAALFMAALVLRSLPNMQTGAVTGQRLVLWYAERPWTLWLLLIALPLAVLVTCLASLLANPERHASATYADRPVANWAQPATLTTAGAALAAAGFLLIVILHMLAN